MRYEIISSSSNGNCIIVEDFLMLDCGVTYNKIKDYIDKIKLIFISHIHKDHLLPTTIKKISYYHPNIKFICGNEEVLKELVKNRIKTKNVYMLKNSKKYDLGLVKCKVEELYHDKQNNLLKWEIKGKKGIYIVDTNSVDHIEAKKYDLYLIESNYQEKLLEKHIQQAIDEKDDNKLFYLNRCPRTHLSYEKANAFLIENMGNNSYYQYIHQSKYNFIDEEEREEK